MVDEVPSLLALRPWATWFLIARSKLFFNLSTCCVNASTPSGPAATVAAAGGSALTADLARATSAPTGSLVGMRRGWGSCVCASSTPWKKRNEGIATQVVLLAWKEKKKNADSRHYRHGLGKDFGLCSAPPNGCKEYVLLLAWTGKGDCSVFRTS